MAKTLVLFLCLFSYACIPGRAGTDDVVDQICKVVSGQIEYKMLDKDYILVGSDDGLEDTDVEMLDLGLYCLGYMPKIINVETIPYDLPALLGYPVHLLYFSGHGSPGTISVAHGTYVLPTNMHLVAENIIFSSCSTLRNMEEVSNFISDNVKYVMGYLDYAYDGLDNEIILRMLLEMKKGKSIPMAFYLANKQESMVSKHWVIYKNDNGELTEYSVRSGVQFSE